MSPPAADEPLVVDLRSQLAPAGDQGRRGTCVSFAVTAIHEHDRTADGNDAEDLAEEVLFWGAKQLDGDTRAGTRFSSADGALRRWGQPVEDLWPYDDARDHRHVDYRPPAAAIDAVNCYLSALRPVPVDRATIESEIVAGRPVVIGIPVWDGLRRGIQQPLPPPGRGDVYPTRHAVAVVGFDRNRDAVLIRNSWGRDWGEDGHLWADAALLSQVRGVWAIDRAAAEPLDVDDDSLVSSKERFPWI